MQKDLVDVLEIIQEANIENMPVYSPVFGSGIVISYGINAINDTGYPIICQAGSITFLFDKRGRYVMDREFDMTSIECLLYPLVDGKLKTWIEFAKLLVEKKSILHVVLEPFDKVLVRDHHCDAWIPTFFAGIFRRDSNSVNDGYMTVSEHIYEQCIPYNETNKKYMFTKESPNVKYIIHDRKEEPAALAEKNAGR